MRNFLKGFRSESNRDSVEAESSEELYGLPGAVPFKWEESPGRAKPPEKDTVLQIEGSHKFYNRLLRREQSTGQSSSSYGTAAHGNVPFLWEAEPGKPKTPAREAEHSTPPPPLSRPPSFQSPTYTIPSPSTVQRPSEPAPKRFAKKVMKFLFPGTFLAGSSENNKIANSKQSASKEYSASSFDSPRLGSDESAIFEAFSCSRSSSFKSFSADDNTSEFGNEDPVFRVSDRASPGCFTRCPPHLSSRNPSRSSSPSRLSRNPSRSRNSVSDQKRINSFDLRSAYASAVARIRRLSDKKSSVVMDNNEYLQREGGSEFQDGARIKTILGSEFQDTARIKTIPGFEIKDSARIKTILRSEFQESPRIKAVPDWPSRQVNISLQEYVGLTGYL